MLVEEMRWRCGGEQRAMELVGKQSRRNEVSFVGLNNARQQTTCKHSCFSATSQPPQGLVKKAKQSWGLLFLQGTLHDSARYSIRSMWVDASQQNLPTSPSITTSTTNERAYSPAPQ